jgi:hypothetical protein
MEDMFHFQVKDEPFGEDLLKCFATKILDAKHEKTDVAEVVKGLTHLNAHQKADLLRVLWENKKMLMELLACIHIKRNTLTLIQMPCNRQVHQFFKWRPTYFTYHESSNR